MLRRLNHALWRNFIITISWSTGESPKIILSNSYKWHWYIHSRSQRTRLLKLAFWSCFFPYDEYARWVMQDMLTNSYLCELSTKYFNFFFFFTIKSDQEWNCCFCKFYVEISLPNIWKFKFSVEKKLSIFVQDSFWIFKWICP